MSAAPKPADVRRVLESTCRVSEELVAAYTPEVHAQLCTLVEPLKELIHDVWGNHHATLRPPVRAIGLELHRLGGKNAQLAVYYALKALLNDQRSRCPDGSPWASVESTLQYTWDGCGEWSA